MTIKGGKIIIFVFLAITIAGFFCIQEVGAEDKININTASLEELDTLPGIGPAKAQAIIDYRETNGSFVTIDDIINVSGIGTATFEDIKDLITIGAVSEDSPSVPVSEDKPLPSPQEDEEKAGSNFSDNIIINEIFPDPAGDDREGEFIEIFNNGNKAVDLSGWRLGDESKRRHELSGIIGAYEHLLIAREESRIALNNYGDTVKLFAPGDERPREEIKYEKTAENLSFSLDEDCVAAGLKFCRWEWSEAATPGRPNLIKELNLAPVAEFYCPPEAAVGEPVYFDSSETFDENGNQLIFNWNFGDGFSNNLTNPEHTFWKEGIYKVKLAVSDGKEEAVNEKIITIKERDKVLSAYGKRSMPQESLSENASVIINEIMPSPAGSDEEGEWIELYNAGETAVDLSGWQIDDSEGGSRPFTFGEETILANGQYKTVNRAESKLALNNDSDEARLFDRAGNIADQTRYEAAEEDYSFARGENGRWFWTKTPTPGEENIISGSGYYDSAVSVLGVANDDLAVFRQYNIPVITSIAQAKNLEPGTKTTVQGVVLVEPGVLGAQYFYIADSAGIQIYNYRKDFPEIVPGDFIEVTGEISEARGEARIKTSAKEDIKILEHEYEPEITDDFCEGINDDYVGQLVRLSGQITERKGVKVYLDDGTGEAVVYIKKYTGINAADLKEGEKISVAGIVGKLSDGLAIMPRSVEDIIRPASAAEGDFLGEPAGDEWVLPATNKSSKLLKYLLALFGSGIVLLAGLLIRARLNGKI